MLGFSIVALCYNMEQRMLLLTPLGILLSFSGITRLVFSAWFFRKGSTWRALVQQSAAVDFLAGGAALFLLQQSINHIAILLGLWLVVSGYFQIRKYAYLKHQWPDCTPAGLTGLLSVVIGAFLMANEQAQWLSPPIDLSVPLGIVGLFKIYAFIKLGQINRRSSVEVPTPERPFSSYSSLNLN